MSSYILLVGLDAYTYFIYIEINDSKYEGIIIDIDNDLNSINDKNYLDFYREILGLDIHK